MKLLSNSFKHLFFIIFLFFLCSSAYTATTDLAILFLDKANEAFGNDNIDEAYKYINQALAVAKDEDYEANVLYFAQTVYKTKLNKLLKQYNDMSFLDIKMNLEIYPKLENTTIKKLIKQVEEKKKINSSNDIDCYTINVGLRINLLKINDTFYLNFNTDVYATILEILPLEANLCKVVLSVPLDKAERFQNYVIYMKKGDILQTRISNQIVAGIINDFEYNKLSF